MQKHKIESAEDHRGMCPEGTLCMQSCTRTWKQPLNTAMSIHMNIHKSSALVYVYM